MNLNQNKKANSISNVDTELFMAARDGNLYRMITLLQFNNRSAYMDCLNRFDQTPSMWAAMSGKLDAIKLLLLFSSDTEIKDKNGLTMMDHLKMNGYNAYIDNIIKFKEVLSEKQQLLSDIITLSVNRTKKIELIMQLLN